MDTCSMSYKGAGMSTAVMNTGASGVPLVEGCFSRCVTKVGMMDFCGAVRLTEHLHGDNAALVISPHHFGIVRWSPTRSTLGIKSISSTGSVFSPCLPGARCCFIPGFTRRSLWLLGRLAVMMLFMDRTLEGANAMGAEIVLAN